MFDHVIGEGVSFHLRSLHALPYFGDNLNATMRLLTTFADRDDVTLHFPTIWRREDPWRTSV